MTFGIWWGGGGRIWAEYALFPTFVSRIPLYSEQIPWAELAFSQAESRNPYMQRLTLHNLCCSHIILKNLNVFSGQTESAYFWYWFSIFRCWSSDLCNVGGRLIQARAVLFLSCTIQQPNVSALKMWTLCSILTAFAARIRINLCFTIWHGGL